jgi:hypothetical protein
MLNGSLARMAVTGTSETPCLKAYAMQAKSSTSRAGGGIVSLKYSCLLLPLPDTTDLLTIVVVINLEDSIAVTQNFVSRTNLDRVLLFLRHRAEQVSGFSCAGGGDNDLQDESGGGHASKIFEAALRTLRPELYYAASNQILVQLPDSDPLIQRSLENCSEETNQNLWHRLQMPEGVKEAPSIGFSFGFDSLDATACDDEE